MIYNTTSDKPGGWKCHQQNLTAGVYACVVARTERYVMESAITESLQLTSGKWRNHSENFVSAKTCNDSVDWTSFDPDVLAVGLRAGDHDAVMSDAS